MLVLLVVVGVLGLLTLNLLENVNQVLIGEEHFVLLELLFILQILIQ